MSEKITDPTQTRQTSHLVSDLQFWTTTWKLLATANHEHQQVIEKILAMTGNQIDKLGPHDTLLEAEKNFVSELGLLQGCLKEQMIRFQRDSNAYSQLEDNIKHQGDDHDLHLSQLNHSLTEARQTLEIQTRVVAKSKQEYHKSMWHIEKAGVNATLTVNSVSQDEMKEHMDELQRQAADHLNKYNKQFDRFITNLETTKKLSQEFDQTFVTMVTGRAAVILKSLQDSIDLTHNENDTKMNCVFGDIDTETITRERLMISDTYEIPIFEDYKERKGVGRRHVRAERTFMTDVEDSSSTEIVSSTVRKASTQQTKLRERKKINKRSKLLYVTVREYKRQKGSQLSLKVGDYIRQLLPPNKKGYAFGLLAHGRLRKKRKKRKGFYPHNHVAPVTDEEVDFSSDDGNDAADDEPVRTRDVKPAKASRNDDSKIPWISIYSIAAKSPGYYYTVTSCNGGKKTYSRSKSYGYTKPKKRKSIFSVIANSSFMLKLRNKRKSIQDDDQSPPLTPEINDPGGPPDKPVTLLGRLIKEEKERQLAEIAAAAKGGNKEAKNGDKEAKDRNKGTNNVKKEPKCGGKCAVCLEKKAAQFHEDGRVRKKKQKMSRRNRDKIKLRLKSKNE